MKAIYISLLLVFISNGMYSQFKKVNILSPKASSLMKYGEYPVSLYTGLIDIKVPIYTIEMNGISIPIELKYHASGIKYDDVSSEVGLGWSLIAGGIIIREIRGARDGQFSSYSRDITKIKVCDNVASPYENDYVKLRQVENGRKGYNYDPSIGRLDGEIDMYSFSFLNHNGSFCFPFLGSEVNGIAPSTGLFIPATGMKVVDRSQPDQRLDLRDMDGVFYRFEVKDVDQNERYKEYYLTKIISADKADTVNFIYDVVSSLSNYIRRPYINYTASLMTTTSIVHPSSTGKVVTDNGGLFYQELRPPRLTRVDFKGGSLSFEYAVINNTTTWDLQRIKIYNRFQSTPLQTVLLTKGQFVNGEKRLDKVTFSNPRGENIDYQFGYSGEPGDIKSGTGIDYWGYYNGNSVPYSIRYIPIFDNMPYGMQGTNRSASELYMQRGVLSKIIYPTKGYSEFTYESHRARYSLATSIVTFGGLRIKEIRNYLDDGSLVEKKWYKYGEDEGGLGIANTYPDIRDFKTESRVLVTHATSSYSPHLCQMKLLTTYSTFPKISYFISGSPVVYTKVSEYVGDNSKDYGKTVYRYQVTLDEKINSYGDTYRINSPDMYLRTYPWKTGKLLSKTVYKKEEAGYHEVYTLQNSYKDINVAEYRNVRVLPHVEFENYFENVNLSVPDIKRDFCNYREYQNYFRGSNPNLTPYDYFNYYITTGLRVLSSSSETYQGVTTYTNYDTYNSNGLPTSVSNITSTGDNILTNFKYPTDYSTAPYAGMKSANILTPIIDKTTMKNGVLVKKEISEYAFWHSKFYAPKNFQEMFQNGTTETRFTYNYDSNGKTLEIVSNGAARVVYLWGYNQTLLVARLENITHAQVMSNALLLQYINQLQNYTVLNTTMLRDNLEKLNYNIRDNLPIDAHVTTYTYRPLVGMASKTAPDGTTTYYDYDDFGRLKKIQDPQGNLMEEYNYNYKK